MGTAGGHREGWGHMETAQSTLMSLQAGKPPHRKKGPKRQMLVSFLWRVLSWEQGPRLGQLAITGQF